MKNFFKIIFNSSPPKYLLPIVSHFSQYSQDFFVRNIIFQKKSGYFVDVGARCGIQISNTYYLESKGWNGICIEPNPEMFDKLIKNRSSENINYAITDTSDRGNMEFIKFNEPPYGNSGLVKTFKNKHRLSNIKHEIILVPTIDLTTILNSKNAPNYIHYLDIDVEGHEYECLKGIDFTKYKFGIIGVETRPQKQAYGDIVSLLEKNSYVPFAVLGSDTFFTLK